MHLYQRNQKAAFLPNPCESPLLGNVEGLKECYEKDIQEWKEEMMHVNDGSKTLHIQDYRHINQILTKPKSSTNHKNAATQTEDNQQNESIRMIVKQGVNLLVKEN